MRTEFRPSAMAYWQAHAIMAVAGGVLAGLLLMAFGNGDPWVGPLGAILAVGFRAAFVRSEAMAECWTLTDTHLSGPADRTIPRAQIVRARPLFGAVQIVTASGDKHLIRYLPDPAAAARAIQSGPRT